MKRLIKSVLRRLGGAAGLDDLLASQRQVSSDLQRVTRACRDVEYHVAVAPDGFPLPPAALQFLVSNQYDTSVSEFLDIGRWCADDMANAMATAGLPLNERRAILDFGCGCGRVLRHMPSMTSGNAEIYGTDYNPKLVEWCQRHLRFAKFATNSLEPPLPFQAGSFDLAYAFSVLTHLTEALQHAWMDEIFRVLQPGGVFVFTTHGAVYAETHLPPVDRAQFDAGNLVVLNATVAGQNTCAAFHPEAYVRNRLANRFEIRAFLPGRVVDAIRAFIAQDVYVLQRAEILTGSVHAYGPQHSGPGS